MTHPCKADAHVADVNPIPQAEGGDHVRRHPDVRETGLARARAHNQELHEQGHIRRHGGYQNPLPM